MCAICRLGKWALYGVAGATASLHSLFRQIDIDEKGTHSLASDHNCLLLEFNCTGSSASQSHFRKKQSKYLPNQAALGVTKNFKKSLLRDQAGTYDDFLVALSSVMQKHTV